MSKIIFLPLPNFRLATALKTSLRRYQKHFLTLRKKYIQCKLDWVKPFLKNNKIILIFRKLQMAEEMREAAGEDEQVNT